MAKFILNQWDFKLIERELVERGLKPLEDFAFSWTEDEPPGWFIEFADDETALIWRLQRGHI